MVAAARLVASPILQSKCEKILHSVCTRRTAAYTRIPILRAKGLKMGQRGAGNRKQGTDEREITQIGVSLHDKFQYFPLALHKIAWSSGVNPRAGFLLHAPGRVFSPNTILSGLNQHIINARKTDLHAELKQRQSREHNKDSHPTQATSIICLLYTSPSPRD